MADGLTGIIDQLRQMREGIETALIALERVKGIEAPVPSWDASAAPVVAADVASRRSAAQKARWAAKRKATKKAAPANVPAESAPAISTETPVKSKPRFTPEGRKRLAEAMRKRWAVKRAASAVKKVARKKTA
jgi:hypothetical protein